MGRPLGKRTLRDTSQYQPHQAVKERMRRVGKLLASAPDSVPDDVKALYLDYSTAKAAEQDLSRFSPRTPVYADVDSVLGDRVAGGLDAVAEAGPDPAQG